ncbi:hypothetical protein [Streptomyces chilikensis]|uniref:Uncharacterized protein n=1 Tax=Streptomyces chilikensis TaxID=1194079 RepID=A0ABV3EXD5_9ACTN
MPRPEGHQALHLLVEVAVTGVQVEVDAGDSSAALPLVSMATATPGSPGGGSRTIQSSPSKRGGRRT